MACIPFIIATIQLIFHEKYLFITVEDDGEIRNKQSKILEIGLKSINSKTEYLRAKKIGAHYQQG